MKKRIKPEYIFFALNLAILVAAGWTFYQAYQLRATTKSGFHPITTNAHKDMAVGQMRVPMRQSREKGFGTCEAPAEIEVRELVRGGSASEGHDLLKVWIKDPNHPGGEFGFRLYRYCEEDDFWYAIYWPGWMGELRGTLETERVKECNVPSDLLEEPGTYIVEIVGGKDRIGACTFELPLSQTEAQGGGAR